ncbi:MAG: CocE/NonD family hydrolase [Bacteroidia bacterium]|nr:CocE/NonD family hydrolase [Bacteroidia bacterium]
MKRLFLLIGLLLSLSPLFGQLLLTPVVDSIPMRDNKVMPVDIFLPGTTQAYPVIFIQTPYNRQLFRFGLPLGVGTALSTSHYVFVTMDWRCFYGAAGACVAQPKRGEDGYDAIEWIAQQPWCNGKIGTWGPSALGVIQYQTARENPPSLDCICPVVADPVTSYQTYYPGGCYREEYVDQLDALGFGTGPLVQAYPVDNVIWQFSETNSWYPQDIKVPAFMIGGWYDHNIDGMIKFMDGLKAQGDPLVRDKHKILVGPWAHGGHGTAAPGSGIQGEMSYVKEAPLANQEANRFFDYYLRGIQNGWDQDSAYRFTLTGMESFLPGNPLVYGENSYPGSLGKNPQKIYLQPDGTMKFNYPSASGPAWSSYQYDPRDPSPTHGGPTLRVDQLQGPYDQKDTVESRNDNLVFRTQFGNFGWACIAGKPKLRLYVQSNCKDTDFMVRLTQENADHPSMLLIDGAFRARFRDGFTAADTSVMDTSVVYPIDIDLPPIATTMWGDEHLRLIITSSNYPRFALNLNNGGPMYVAGDTLVATNKIYHSPTYSSYLEVSVSLAIGRGEELPPAFVRVYPNPTQGLVQIELDRPDEGTYRLLDLQGKLLLEGNYHGKGFDLDLSQQPAGLYLLSLSGRLGKTVEKIVKE